MRQEAKRRRAIKITFAISPCLALALALALAAAVPAQAARFTYTSLDNAGIATQVANVPHLLNNSDAVVGMAAAPLPATEGFVWKAGTFTRFSTASNLVVFNNKGLAAGFGRRRRGYLTLDTNTGTTHVYSNGFTGTLWDINEAGQVVAQTKMGGTAIGYVLNKGRKTIIRVHSGGAISPTYPIAINAAGMVTGYYNDGDTDPGFLYAGGTYTTFSVPGASNTTPIFITDSGIVGGSFSSIGTDSIAGFVYQHGRFTYYLPPNATAACVTGSGPGAEVVGYYLDANIRQHGFIYHTGTLYTIDFPGALGTEVLAVNAAGTLAGTYTDIAHATHAFIATSGARKP